MSRCVLFVTYGGGHIAMMLPVIRALREQAPDVRIELLALTTARAAAERAQEPARGFAEFQHLVDPEFVGEWGSRLVPEESHPAVSRQETLAYTVVNFWDLVQQHGLKQAQALYRERGRYGFHPIHFFRRLLAHLQPDVVVTTNSPRSEQAAMEAAQEVGVPTVSMVDLFAMDFDPYLRRKSHADRIMVMLPRVRDNLVAAGFSRDSIIVTGNPAFDGLFSAHHRAAAQEMRHRLGWEQVRVVLWAGIVERLPSERENIAAGVDYGRAVEAELRRWCAARDDRALIVRYHPNEAHLFEPTLSSPRVYVATPLTEHIHPQILASDAVVVTGSTVGVETAAAGVPVLSMESSGSSSVMSYAKLGISHGVGKIAALGAALDEVLSRPNKLNTQLQQGPAAPRIAAEIRGLIRP